ncbi:MAG: SAM-dependent methyltransferase [Myxococcales bacterium]|nr:SAM-dependent methyltransferase [Myxococcales bacterium]
MRAPGERWRDVYAERIGAVWTEGRRRALTGGRQMQVTPWDAPFLLRALGLLDAEGELVRGRERKLRQVGHLLGFLRPALEELDGPVVRIVDAGCGRSTLGALVCWWLARQGREPRLLGIDRNARVLEGCRERAELAGDGVQRFAEASLEDVDLGALWTEAHGEEARVDVLLALHACDTATDEALALAVNRGAQVIVAAPCCHKQLRPQLAAPAALGPVLRHGILKTREADLVTDALRAALLEAVGFEAKVFEFISTEHTDRNLMIAATRRAAPRPGAEGEARALAAFYGIERQELADRLGVVLHPQRGAP